MIVCITCSIFLMMLFAAFPDEEIKVITKEDPLKSTDTNFFTNWLGKLSTVLIDEDDMIWINYDDNNTLWSW